MAGSSFPEVVPPQGPIEPVFTDVFRVRGAVRMAPLVRIPRNMVVVRHGGELTLVNAVRLDPAGEAALDALGKVAHVVKIGTHGMDDPWYVHRYGARLWALPGARLAAGLAADATLAEGAPLPFPDARLFVFRLTRAPEAALLVERDGGVLLTCDSVQHWTDTVGASPVAKLATHAMGFMKPAQIGPPWRKAMTPPGGTLRPDFERLAELPFRHLVGGHGGVLRDVARERLRESITRVYGA
ncbi:MAG: hypothetical protein H6745_31770 [Deltaproteobacteria bacterium]|nr:hypothetical protein [Deltaproteobacteria bacterium]